MVKVISEEEMIERREKLRAKQSRPLSRGETGRKEVKGTFMEKKTI